MDSIVFYNGTEIDGGQLNEIQQLKATAIKDRFADTRFPGIIQEKSPDTIVYTDGKSIGIYALVAYNKDGERIEIEPNKNPVLPAVDGLLPDENGQLIHGGSSLIPQSKYTLVIVYAERLTEPTSVHVTTKQQYLTANVSTYKLYLRDFNAQKEEDIVLATVIVDENGNVSIDESVREISSIPPTSVSGDITTPDGQQDPSYGTNVSFLDHINSVGSGVVTKKNPHGYTPADLGIDVGALGDHQRLLHCSGIRTDDIGSTYSALYPSYRRESLTSNEIVYIQRLDKTLNEMLVVNGKSITSSDIPATYTYSFSGKNSSTFEGYYIFSYDSTNMAFVVNGPYESEEDPNFTRVLSTVSLFPICSLKWQYIEYDVTGDETNDVGSYDIVPSTFKDRRVFNNTSVSTFRPDQLFALTQFAPVCTDVACLHNARIIGAHTDPAYNIAGKTLNLTINGNTNVNITFTGVNPLPVSTIIDQMLSKFVSVSDDGNISLIAYPRITDGGNVSISAPISISINNQDTGSAAVDLGFSSENGNMSNTSDDLIKEMIYYGDRNGFILFNYDENDDVTEIDYYLGGGLLLKNVFNYINGNIVSVNEIVSQLW